MPETYENWLSIVTSYIYCACQTREINQPYSVDFTAPEDLWNPLSTAVFSKYL